VVDGVPRSFTSIEPEAIESISVLKDALSTVLYGQRSSNGILLITTKKGIRSTPRISFTAQRGTQKALNMPEPLSAFQYATLYNEALQNEGKNVIYTPEALNAYRDNSDPYKYPNVNWQDVLLNKNTSISRYNLNVEGGGNGANYFVSLDYLNEGGLFKTADFNTYNTDVDIKRYIIRSNVNVDLSNSLNVGLNFFGRIYNGNQPGGTVSTILNTMLVTPNNAYPVFNPNGSLGGNRNYSNNVYGQSVYSGYRPDYARDLTADLNLHQKLDVITKGLYAKALVSFNSGLSQQINRSKTFAVYNMKVSSASDTSYEAVGTNGQQANSLSVNSRLTSTYTKVALGYDKIFGQNKLNVQALADRQSTTIDIDLPSTYSNLAGQASYSFADKYFGEAAASYSGLNRYMEGKRYGLFYAFGLGWRISAESFMKAITWIDDLKLRASYGRTGNANVGYFMYNQYYADATAYNFGTSASSAGGFTEQTLANPDATWEKANKFNVGVDASLLHNKLAFTAEYFTNRYFDLMQQRGLSSRMIGQDFPNENLGINRYTGSEFAVTWKNHFKAVNYYLHVNASMLQSRVIFQDEVFRRHDWMKRTGQQVGQTFGYIADGFYQNQAEINVSPRIEGYFPVPGDIKYRDLNNDGVINQYDETVIGNKKPLMYYGTTLGADLFGFDIILHLQGVTNNDVLLSGNREWEFQSNGRYQAFEHHLGRWTNETAASATYPRLSIGTNVNNHRTSSFWLKNASYLRLQNAEVGYTVPGKVTNRLKLKTIRVFANGFNLVTITSLDKRTDPEAFDALYPLQRVVNFGINIKF
jgi:TonB-linked SusC/RagA family outer membrane protein